MQIVPQLSCPGAYLGEKSLYVKLKLGTMVTIIGVEKRKNRQDEEFNVLIIQGGIESVLSKLTGKPYITARKTSVPCTFDDVFVKHLIGKELPGTIERITCDPYEYIIPKTGEKITLEHTYQYSGDPVNIEETVMG